MEALADPGGANPISEVLTIHRSAAAGVGQDRSAAAKPSRQRSAGPDTSAR